MANCAQTVTLIGAIQDRAHIPYPSALAASVEASFVKTLKGRAFRHSGQKLVTGVARP
jgi:hypothetical protein